MDSIIIRKQIAQQKAIDRLQLRQADTVNRTSTQRSYSLTLTRTNTLAFTTVGTFITWESETRNNGFTWSSTNITIPTSGYYAITCSLAVTTNVTFVNLEINGVLCYSMYGQSSLYFNGTTTRYFTTGDVIQISARASANGTINVYPEGSSVNGDSPILHIVQLTGDNL